MFQAQWQGPHTLHRLSSASVFSTAGFPQLWGRTVSFLRFSVPGKGLVSFLLQAALCMGVLMPQRGQGALPQTSSLMGKRQEGLLPCAAPSLGDFLALILAANSLAFL